MEAYKRRKSSSGREREQEDVEDGSVDLRGL